MKGKKIAPKTSLHVLKYSVPFLSPFITAISAVSITVISTELYISNKAFRIYYPLM
jgi:hypothetical protein